MALSAPQLAFTRVTADNAQPSRWLYVVHGIFGAGRNWTAVAKRIARNRPEWGAMLIDLREHGASQGFAAPHTIENASRDLQHLADSTGIQPEAILGHSFGGKVSLAFASHATSVKQAWIIDSTPAASTPGGSAFNMLQIVKSIPDTFPTRDEAVQMLMQHRVTQPIAMWMATNLQEEGGVYHWRFRKTSMEALIEDFFRTDLWDVVEHTRDGLEVHLVKASESSILEGAELARAEKAADNVHTFIHVVEGGHWLNADNPDAVVDLLSKHLP